MNKNIIFVSGIHGVGKTTFAKKLSGILGDVYYSSSDLIKRQNSALDFPDKKVSDVDKNQDILIQGINNFVSETNFILDGHFVLLGSDGQPIDIPEKTFVDLSPKQLILLSLDVDTIYERLKFRGNIISQETLGQLQNKEVAQCYYISKILDVNVVHLKTELEVKDYLYSLKKYEGGLKK